MEKFNNTLDPEEQSEKIEGDSRYKPVLFNCFKKWFRLGIVATTLYTGYEYKKNYDEKENAYRNHIENTFNIDDQKNIEHLKSQIGVIFGDMADKIISAIENGDRNAFFQQTKERQPLKISGLKVKAGSIAENLLKFRLPEEYKVFPSGWVNGSIDEIRLVKSKIETALEEKVGAASGSFSQDEFFGNVFGRIILLYFNDSPSSSIALDNEDEVTHITARVIDHELAHANDWRFSTRLNLEDRYRLLVECVERCQSEDHYSPDEKYHELFDTKDSLGLFQSVSEYWAEICEEYFGNPKKFKQKYPKDFELVDKYVRIIDPQFNIFDENRGAFDPHTGKIREIYLPR
jgi:hypothetical protein